jgi:hypothetical protein
MGLLAVIDTKPSQGIAAGLKWPPVNADYFGALLNRFVYSHP